MYVFILLNLRNTLHSVIRGLGKFFLMNFARLLKEYSIQGETCHYQSDVKHHGILTLISLLPTESV